MSHSYAALYCHYVFATKERRMWISPEIRERLHQYIGGICRGERCELLAAGGMPDHMHLLVRQHAAVSCSDLMRRVKSVTSGWIHDNWSSAAAFEWQSGYGGFSVSKSAVEEVRQYVLMQEEHHRVLTFQQEFETLLRKHEVEYDPKYLWISER